MVLTFQFGGLANTRFETAREFNHERPFKFINFTLPISYKREEFLETARYDRTYSKEEAISAGKERARADLERDLPEGAEVLREKVLHEAVDNGKVNLQIDYQVIEDITSEQPIIQGD